MQLLSMIQKDKHIQGISFKNKIEHFRLNHKGPKKKEKMKGHKLISYRSLFIHSSQNKTKLLGLSINRYDCVANRISQKCSMRT